jgi:hypothetical protein
MVLVRYFFRRRRRITGKGADRDTGARFRTTAVLAVVLTALTTLTIC